MNVDKWIKILTAAQKAGCGKMNISVEVPCVCVTNDGDIIENEYRAKTKQIRLSAKTFIDAMASGCGGIVIAVGCNEVRILAGVRIFEVWLSWRWRGTLNPVRLMTQRWFDSSHLN